MPTTAAPLETNPANGRREEPASSPPTDGRKALREGTVDEVLRGTAGWCVVHGDALHVLRDLPDSCVSAFVTDPPYSSGGAFRGDRVKETTAKYVSTNSANKGIPAFEGDVRDQRSFTLWSALWSSEAWRAGVDGCHLVAFSDWRQLPALCDALQAGGWLWRGIAAWDKTEASRPRNGGFRAQCEFMAWVTRGPFAETGVYLDGCFRVLADRDKLHQAVKPLALMERLVTIAPAGGLIVDPFAGSGTTVAAALRQGRRVLGIEISREWAELARERVRADASGSDYAALLRGQQALFSR
ncbi:MAG TPA: DNA methyltransferase [Polyangiaceae bacterium]|nr:DNA methyltransferase [Polyangiaceae bacterium]